MCACAIVQLQDVQFLFFCITICCKKEYGNFWNILAGKTLFKYPQSVFMKWHSITKRTSKCIYISSQDFYYESWMSTGSTSWAITVHNAEEHWCWCLLRPQNKVSCTALLQWDAGGCGLPGSTPFWLPTSTSICPIATDRCQDPKAKAMRSFRNG